MIFYDNNEYIRNKNLSFYPVCCVSLVEWASTHLYQKYRL